MFADRYDAGRLLAAAVGVRHALVLGLPRGGVPVASEVVCTIGGELSVLVVRKLGAPFHPEYGVGALAEDDPPWWDARAVRRVGLSGAAQEALVARERAELERRRAVYRPGPLPSIEGRTVVVVDDGLATGGTARAALRRVRREAPSRLVLAVPVGAADTVAALRREADEVVCVSVVADLHAVGEHYLDFRATTDEEVVRLLRSA